MLIVANIDSFDVTPHVLNYEKVSCHCDSPTKFLPYFCPFFCTCVPLTNDIIGILGPHVTLATLQGPAFHTVSICKVSAHSAIWYVSHFIAKLSLISGVNPARTGYFARRLCRAQAHSKIVLLQKFKVVRSCTPNKLYCCFNYFWIQDGFLSLWHRKHYFTGVKPSGVYCEFATSGIQPQPSHSAP